MKWILTIIVSVIAFFPVSCHSAPATGADLQTIRKQFAAKDSEIADLKAQIAQLEADTSTAATPPSIIFNTSQADNALVDKLVAQYQSVAADATQAWDNCHTHVITKQAYYDEAASDIQKMADLYSRLTGLSGFPGKYKIGPLLFDGEMLQGVDADASQSASTLPDISVPVQATLPSPDEKSPDGAPTETVGTPQLPLHTWVAPPKRTGVYIGPGGVWYGPGRSNTSTTVLSP